MLGIDTEILVETEILPPNGSCTPYAIVLAVKSLFPERGNADFIEALRDIANVENNQELSRVQEIAELDPIFDNQTGVSTIAEWLSLPIVSTILLRHLKSFFTNYELEISAKTASMKDLSGILDTLANSSILLNIDVVSPESGIAYGHSVCIYSHDENSFTLFDINNPKGLPISKEDIKSLLSGRPVAYTHGRLLCHNPDDLDDNSHLIVTREFASTL